MLFIIIACGVAVGIALAPFVGRIALVLFQIVFTLAFFALAAALIYRGIYDINMLINALVEGNTDVAFGMLIIGCWLVVWGLSRYYSWKRNRRKAVGSLFAATRRGL